VFNQGGVFVYDAHMNLYAVAAATGKLVWTQSVEDEFGGKEIHWQSAASPIVLGERVIVPGGGEGQAFLAFDRKTGKVLWKSGTGTMTHATPTVASIDGKQQVLFFMRRGVVAVDPENGEELWEYPFDFRTATAISPVVHEDIVSVAAGYGIGGGACKVSKSGTRWTAKEIWRKKDSAVGNIWSTPVCVDGYMYGMFSAKKYGDGPLKCIDIRDGEVKWEEEGFGQGHVSLAGDKLLALTDAGELVVVDPKPSGYQEVTRAKVVDGKCWSTPVFANGHIFVRSTTSGVCLKP
jgi:outer membrane protein assembly factor BamB